ncbi:toxin-antitoxin system HicB family antitoxin [Singulisphaera sp. PoT]|uniref:toxin-antitoxin system HicB family antitoxin n=1 Tax=Singulisphaera sp. PoT TaxID=3411797 RepID=UPI003BF5C88C
MPATVVHFQIRMPPPLHERLASLAREQGHSLNSLIVTILEEANERRRAGEAEKAGEVA